MVLPIPLDKYQICAVAGCGCDAVQQRTVINAGVTYLLGVCSDRKHWAQTDGIDVVSQLNRRVLCPDYVFVCPPGHTTKYKYNPKALVTCEGWSWEYRPHKWKNLKGELKNIVDLAPTEFINSAFAIVGANYKRVSPRVTWVYQLDKPTQYYIYPVGKLVVERAEAHSKLEEFYRVAVICGRI